MACRGSAVQIRMAPLKFFYIKGIKVFLRIFFNLVFKAFSINFVDQYSLYKIFCSKKKLIKKLNFFTERQKEDYLLISDFSKYQSAYLKM